MVRLDPFRCLTALAAAWAFAVATPVAANPRSAPSTFDAMIADAKATMLVDPAKTIPKAQAAEAMAGRLSGRSRDVGIATARWLQGEAQLRLDNVSAARPLIGSALATVRADPAPSKLKGDILLSDGGLQTSGANVADALSDYQSAFKIFQSVGETRSQAIALVSIAVLYQEAKDYPNAIRYSKQALDVYKGDPQLLLTIYNNTAFCLSEMNRPAEAEQNYRQALLLAEQMKSATLQVQILRNIARMELKKGDLAAADQTISREMQITRVQKVGVTDADDLSLNAQAALQRGNLDRARELVERSFRGVDTTKTALPYRGLHETAYLTYRRLGDDENALIQLEALKRLDDQTSTLAASANTALAAARFDFANQELKITTLQRDEAKRTIAFERSRARTQQFIFIGAGVITIIIVSMLGFGLVTIRRSRNEVRAANIDLASTNSALAKALAAKTEFLATTSHEIRTPLNGILGMTQVMLADRALGEATRDRIGVVHDAGVTMRALVDDILDVAKMETGNLTIEQAPFDLKATLTDLSRMWREQAEGKGIGFTLDLGHCPGFVEGDAARLRQIAFNLLSNALKFTENGAVSLSAKAATVPDGERLVIKVSDTGIGISPDKHELIFESFRQADGGTTRKFGGTGLGLSICRNLARAMQGDVTVASDAGQGAVFTLDLPLVRADAPAIPVAAEVAVGDALLILDRNPITRAMLRTVLAPRASTITLAASIDEARHAIEAGGVGLLLIDDGTIKALDEPAAAVVALTESADGGGVRVALLWAGLDEETRAGFTAAGVDLVIAKPIAGPALAAALYPVSDSSTVVPNTLVTQAA